VKTVVANAVTLHPVIPRFSRFKITNLVPLVAKLTPFMNPQWGLAPPTKTAKALALMVRLTHHECDNAVCKMVSFTYGTGFPALWRHENLNPETHEWVKQEFAHVPLSFFRQMAKCVEAGHLVSVESRPELPRSFVAQAPQTDARFAFFAGKQNICFLPTSQERTFRFFDERRPFVAQDPQTDARFAFFAGKQNICFLPTSQERTFRFFDERRPGYHSLVELPGYGHLDVFMGKQAARDVFPLMLAELER